MLNISAILLILLIIALISTFGRKNAKMHEFKKDEGAYIERDENLRRFARDLLNALNEQNAVYIKERFDSIGLYEMFEENILDTFPKASIKSVKDEKNETALLSFNLKSKIGGEKKVCSFRVILDSAGLWEIVDYNTGKYGK